MKKRFVCLLCCAFTTLAFTQSSTSAKDYYLNLQFIQINAQQEQEHVQLSWSSSMYNHNDFFTLERSKDGINFTPFKGAVTIGDKKKKHLIYTETDFTPHPLSYYRIKQTDADGNFVYSSVKKVRLKENDFASVFSNPANENEIQVIIDLEEQTEVDITITDMEEREVYGLILPRTSKKEPVSIDVTNFNAGFYLVNIYAKNSKHTHTEKISIVK